MIIRSITLKNFRQFIGEQTISFSTNPNKKVTFVMAESGVGKTTIIKAFQWVLFGECTYKTVFNKSISDKMEAGNETKVEVQLKINHSNIDYTITRYQIFRKINVRIDADTSIIIIDYKDENGIARQCRGRDAESMIKKFMHRDLFPYFFLEGENLTKVGEQMSRRKASSNNDFIKAIKGLLGFNYLYETVKHLRSLSSSYDDNIKILTSNQELKNVIDEIQNYTSEIDEFQDRINNIDNEIEYYENERDKLSEKLLEFGEIEVKQRRTKELENEISWLKTRISDEKKQLFKKFSAHGFNSVIESLLDEAKETLKNSDSMDKGIPGMNVDAVKYMLEHHICICGEKLVEGSEHWKKLNDLITYLPPNNISTELRIFSNRISRVERDAASFDDDYLRDRQKLSIDISDYNNKIDELHSLNEEIGGVNEDIGSLKNKEEAYNTNIVNLKYERVRKESAIKELKNKISVSEDNKKSLEAKDARTQKLQSYKAESDSLLNIVNNFIIRKENEKREKLTKAINEIFKDFYNEKITFSLDTDYTILIKIFDKDLSEDFTSGGQDVAVALAFIGAIIKLNSEAENDTDGIDDEHKEGYPLVMDAPTSNFGMKQMKSFSEIMPKITDQIIVFINDKDGPILRELMKSNIGSEWMLRKEDSFHSRIDKGVF